MDKTNPLHLMTKPGCPPAIFDLIRKINRPLVAAGALHAMDQGVLITEPVRDVIASILASASINLAHELLSRCEELMAETETHNWALYPDRNS